MRTAWLACHRSEPAFPSAGVPRRASGHEEQGAGSQVLPLGNERGLRCGHRQIITLLKTLCNRLSAGYNVFTYVKAAENKA
jgi:hypothetical protein